jgi:hypothetical protein
MDYTKEDEVWKDIEGYVGLYQISSYGRVRSLDREVMYEEKCKLRKGKVLTLQSDSYGYHVTNLNKEKKRKEHKVHRLLSQAFIPNPFNKPYINHIDGDKQNNNLNNLEWCTPKENMVHSAENNLNNRNKAVEKYGTNGDLVKVYYSIREASRDSGVCNGSISKACKGKLETAGGYRWKLVD